MGSPWRGNLRNRVRMNAAAGSALHVDTSSNRGLIRGRQCVVTGRLSRIRSTISGAMTNAVFMAQAQILCAFISGLFGR